MEIPLVSNYIPGGRPVSEYCYYLVEALKKIDEIVKITVLADVVQGEPSVTRDGKVTIWRCWEFDSPLTPWRVSKTVRSLNPDICWFNITLGSFGMTTANFAGLLSPLIVERLLGIPCLITLHNIVDLTDTRETKFRGGKLTILGARIATRILCKASLVSVLLPEYEPILRREYGAKNVKIVPLGTLGQPID